VSHTKEPWRLGKLTHPRDYETVRETVGPHDVVVDTDDGVYVLAFCNYNFPQDALANARRIVACVNACAGISTESMEVGGVGSIFSLGLEEQRRGDVAEQQRDALLAALEDIAQWTERYTQPGHPISTVARRAIASAKGGAA